MTEPIREKFERLSDLLDQHNGQTQQALADILAALEAGADPTAGLTALLNELAAFHTDVNTAASLITFALTKLTPIDDNVLAISEVLLPGWDNITGINEATTAIADMLQPINADWGTVKDAIVSSDQRLMRLEDRMAEVLQAIAGLNTLLQCVCTAVNLLAPDNPIDPANPLSCPNPFMSVGMWLGPFGSLWSGENIILAVFPPQVPSGLAIGTVFGITENYTELTTDHWEQWSVYVESDEPQFAIAPLVLQRYPTNKWITIPGSGSRSFSVSARGGIKVYLCYKGPDSSMGCEWFYTDPANIIEDQFDTYTGEYNATVFPANRGAVNSTESTPDVTGNFMIGRDGINAFLPYSVEGWTLRAVTPHYFRAYTDGVFGGVVDFGPGQTVTIPGPSTYLAVIGTSGVASTWELCPPPG